jgi:hypothetical protein
MMSNFSISPLSWYCAETSTSIFEKRAGFSASVAFTVSSTLLTSALLDFMAARRLLVKHPPQPHQKILTTHGPVITVFFFYRAITGKVMIADFTFTR